MSTECTPSLFDFEPIERRRVVASFDGGRMTSDSGALLLREVDRILDLTRKLSTCFVDHRHADRVEHSVAALLAQRIHGIAMGYEDLNDHDTLRHDPMMALMVDRLESKRRSDCAPGAGRNTLNRLELSANGASGRYRKIEADFEAIEELLVDLFLDAHQRPGKKGWLILDLDATDFPLYGQQEGRFFHGYYDSYCYLPLYIFCDTFPLAAKLRPSKTGGASGALDEVKRIVDRIRRRWPGAPILLRADSDFSRDELMTWCEQNRVDFIFGMARNQRLEGIIKPQLEEVRQRVEQSGEAARVFRSFFYTTRDSWSRTRHIVAKAEHTLSGSNPRFIVTSLSCRQYLPDDLYEEIYCARGEMENRLKEQQLCLFADRVSTHTMRSNQLRLWFATFAYILLDQLRKRALQGTQLAKARCDTIRIRLLKIGALVKISVRRILFSMASSHPWQHEFHMAHTRLIDATAPPPA